MTTAVHRDLPRPVSFNDEALILVDAQDNIEGYDSKANVHGGQGRRHRAFSIFLFSEAGEVLLHRRSADKPLWPGYWTNSCCSHPRRGESYAEAARRRLDEELGLSTRLHALYRFEYRAQYQDKGSEHELCSVFVGRYERALPIHVNPLEIAEYRWVPAVEIDAWIVSEPESLTPWFLQEWKRLCSDQRARLRQVLKLDF